MNEILLVKQGEMSINGYFNKVKTPYQKISDLDYVANIFKSRMRIIIIYGLNPNYKAFVTIVQGWLTQPFSGSVRKFAW